MKGRLLVLNLLLLGLLVFSGITLRERYQRARAREQALLQQRVPPIPAPLLAPIPAVGSTKAVAYVDVAQRLVFSRDRNPNVIIDPVVPPPPKPMPELPRAHGVMSFGGTPTVILSEKAGAPHQGYRPGDKIGEFTLLAVNNTHILFEWDGLRVLRKLEDLTDASGPPQPSQQAAAAPAPQAAPPPQTTTVVQDSTPGPGEGEGATRACKPGDASPAGTVMEGYRKVVTPTPFGNICEWQQVR